VKRAHVSAMTKISFARIAVLAVVVAAAATAGCTTTGTSGGGYSSKGSRGGGWENFRAEAPIVSPRLVA
jgi:hypothetical protein